MSEENQLNIMDLLLKVSNNSALSCVKIFEIINDNSLSVDDVASAIDAAKIKISACQMGLFSHRVPPADIVSEILKNKISSNLENGKLPCKNSWNIATELNIKKMDVASACETLKIKISNCQLKAF